MNSLRTHLGALGSRRFALASAFAACAIALSGCGGSNSSSKTSAHHLNSYTLERSIAQSILTQDHLYTKVLCPSGVAEHAGATFNCQAELQVGRYTVPVKQTDGQGHVSWNARQPLVLLHMPNVVNAIESAVHKQRGLAVKVTCPVQVLQQQGLTFNCSTTTKGNRRVHAGTYTFKVTEADSHGHVTFVGI